jgi:hypothetical protein
LREGNAVIRRLISVAVLALAASPAWSALLDISGGVLYYQPTAGVSNRVTVSRHGGYLSVRDAAERITLGSEAILVGWKSVGRNAVLGPALSVRGAAGIDLGAGLDRLNIQAPLAVCGDIFLSAETIAVRSPLHSTCAGQVSLHADNLVLRATVESRRGLVVIATNGSARQRGNGSVLAARLKVHGRGIFVLTGDNDIGLISASLDPGSISFRDRNDLVVGNIGGAPFTLGISTGLPASGGSVALTAGCRISVDSPIDTSSGIGGLVTIAGNVVVNSPVLAGAGDITLVGLGHQSDSGTCPP